MPGYNGKGPNGQGPLTGRGEGYCAKEEQSSTPQQPNQEYGVGRGGLPRGGGRGRAFGGRRGMGRGFKPGFAYIPNLFSETKLDQLMGKLEQLINKTKK